MLVICGYLRFGSLPWLSCAHVVLSLDLVGVYSVVLLCSLWSATGLILRCSHAAQGHLKQSLGADTTLTQFWDIFQSLLGGLQIYSLGFQAYEGQMSQPIMATCWPKMVP